MCTVTYLPLNANEFILTSNRDVPYIREKALEPKEYHVNNTKLYYPKDGKAGGSWIGYSSKKRALCVLNGGFENHISKPHYKKSRGMIVLELLQVKHIGPEIKKINLIDIEPFTLIIVDWYKELELIELVWDGENKHIKTLDQKPQIWSSSTLYSEEIKKMRRNWFDQWQQENEFTEEHILHFHHHAGIGDKKSDVLMKRQEGGTVSITIIIKDEKGLIMNYEPIRS